MDKKVAGILCYISFLFIIPLILVKDDSDVRFHVNQGLVLFLVGWLGGTVCGFIPGIGGILGTILGIFTFVLMIIGIVNVCKDETKPLPLIGGIKIIK
ncbi:MAG: hypothetical protein J6B87_02220 [Clostridia bacterium]|nr:hypothetical protein [Clostridia bacterium]